MSGLARLARAPAELRIVVLFALLMAIISLQGDTRMWGGKTDMVYQLRLLPISLLFLGLLTTLLKVATARATQPRPASRSALWVAGGLGTTFLAASALIMRRDAATFAAWGYTFPQSIVAIAVGVFAVIFAAAAVRRSSAIFLAAAVAAYAGSQLVRILYFSIGPRSDMLPILKAGALELWAGRNPYYLYPDVLGLRLPYLPGNVAFFVPAAVLQFDARVVHAAFAAFAALILGGAGGTYAGRAPAAGRALPALSVPAIA